MFYYLYKITNLNNNRFYIGARQSNVSPENDRYFGSGKILKEAIKKYGKKNFKKEILELFDCQFDMYAKEGEIVNEEFLANPLVYNLVPGGEGGDHWSKLPNRDDIIDRKSKTTRAIYAAMTKEEKSKKYGRVGKKNSFYGKTHPPESVKRYREKNAEYNYSITSPDGILFNAISLKYFCKENSLNRDTLMYFMNKGVIPAPSSVGPKSKNNLRANTTGWSITKTLI